MNFTLAENLALREYNTPKMSDHGWPRATARSRQGDTKAAITDYLKKHPGSTAGDLAKGLNLQRNSVSTRLTQMAKAGEIKKATRGYEAK